MRTTLFTRRPPGTAREPDDLFAGKRSSRLGQARRKLAPELAAARVLCRQLGRKRVSTEKKRLVHLICLNLVAILKHRSQRA